MVGTFGPGAKRVGQVMAMAGNVSGALPAIALNTQTGAIHYAIPARSFFGLPRCLGQPKSIVNSTEAVPVEVAAPFS